MKLKARIKPDGSLIAIYSDVFPTLAPGPMEMERVSNVEFNQTSQVWEAVRPDGSIMCSHQFRDECLRLEKELAENELFVKL